MFERPETAWTFKVREHAPNVLLMGNLGLVQARQMTTRQVQDLCAETGADALCIHLNPAMEIVQPGGDRDFTGGLDVLRRLVAELPIPVVAKETGCGLSRGVGERLTAIGIKHVDVSGAGGTSWVAVEAHRLLKRACLQCHRADKRKGGLRLDTRADAMAGGESGPALVPGDTTSLLLQRVKLDGLHADVMPRRGKLLSPSEIALLSTWIERGAPWPATAKE